MRIHGVRKVVTVTSAQLEQPYPVAIEREYFIDGKKVDKAVMTEKVDLLLDGVPYSGARVYLLFKDPQ